MIDMSPHLKTRPYESIIWVEGERERKKERMREEREREREREREMGNEKQACITTFISKQTICLFLQNV